MCRRFLTSLVLIAILLLVRLLPRHCESASSTTLKLFCSLAAFEARKAWIYCILHSARLHNQAMLLTELVSVVPSRKP